MAHRLFSIAALLLAALSSPAAAQSRQPNWPEYMTIGTGSEGGTYHVYGQGLAKLLTRPMAYAIVF